MLMQNLIFLCKVAQLGCMITSGTSPGSREESACTTDRGFYLVPGFHASNGLFLFCFCPLLLVGQKLTTSNSNVIFFCWFLIVMCSPLSLSVPANFSSAIWPTCISPQNQQHKNVGSYHTQSALSAYIFLYPFQHKACVMLYLKNVLGDEDCLLLCTAGMVSNHIL